MFDEDLIKILSRQERILKMNTQDKRWFNNIKKAFYESDIAYQNNNKEVYCLRSILIAIDTATNLEYSLSGKTTKSKIEKST